MTTIAAFARSAVATARLARADRLRSARGHLGLRLAFADGTTSEVFRETVVHGAPPTAPSVLIVQFRLRHIGVMPLWHALFRVECVVHTPLFAGFPGFRSKLWLSDLGTGVYRGLYEWDGADRARDYAETLARLLRIVSLAGSVRYHVIPGIARDAVLADPGVLAGGRTWWRVVSIDAALHGAA